MAGKAQGCGGALVECPSTQPGQHGCSGIAMTEGFILISLSLVQSINYLSLISYQLCPPLKNHIENGPELPLELQCLV